MPKNKGKERAFKGWLSGQPAGFTLMEMTVSIFIIGLLSGIFLVNYRAGGTQAELKNAAQKIASDFRLAQNYCLGTRDFNSQTVQGGWGIYVNKNDNQYIIFADVDEDGIRQADESEDLKVFNLPSNMEISEISGGDDGDEVTVIFYPPDPITMIDGDNTQLAITVREKNTLRSYDVKVNKIGLIEVN